MTLRTDSYSSVADVTSLTRHLLDGHPAYSSETRPTITEVESFIDQASGLLNIAVTKYGFTPASIAANSTAKLSCDMWVMVKAGQLCELASPIQGLGENETRSGIFGSIIKDADKFAQTNAQGWKRLGITAANNLSSGLSFTGLGIQADRTDQDDTTREQPLFVRGQLEDE